jgi:Sulfotransferase domain
MPAGELAQETHPTPTPAAGRLLDFVVIGAQKSGTTTLHRHLSAHPALHLPAEKEADFFNHPERVARGWDWYLEEFFPNAPEGARLGTVTPQYMCDPAVPARLAARCPDARLIAILRDPVERAFSHHRMNVRRGLVAADFEAEMGRLLPVPAGASPRPEDGTVERGEYGRILADFLKFFPRDRLLVLYTDDLERDPAACLTRIYDFLGIETVLPKDLGRRDHAGGTRQRLPNAKALVKRTPLRHLLRTLPGPVRRRWAYRFDQWNVVPEPAGPVPLSPEVLGKLRARYAADGERLAALVGAPPPWLARYRA